MFYEDPKFLWVVFALTLVVCSCILAGFLGNQELWRKPEDKTICRRQFADLAAFGGGTIAPSVIIGYVSGSPWAGVPVFLVVGLIIWCFHVYHKAKYRDKKYRERTLNELKIGDVGYPIITGVFSAPSPLEHHYPPEWGTRKDP